MQGTLHFGHVRKYETEATDESKPWQKDFGDEENSI